MCHRIQYHKGGIAIFNTEEITSRQNPYVSYVCKLSEKKHRDNEGRFRFDGVKLFREALRCGVDIEAVLLTQKTCEKLLREIEESKYSFKVKLLSQSVFEKISEEKSPEGVICVAKHIDKFHKFAKIDNEGDCPELAEVKGQSLFVLESVRDPGNLGTVIRTAAAFGVDNLILSNDCADIYNPRTIRAAMGTLFHQRIIRVDDLPTVIRLMSAQGRRAYAATLGKEAKLLGKAELEKLDFIVVGNEGHGLSDDVIASCDSRLLIPMMPDTESLNAAVASSVCLWEQFGRTL